MPIKAVDSDEVAFEASFRERLPAVEKTMIAHGLDPSAFTITKGRNRSYGSYYGTGRYYDYKVNTGEDSFVVSFATDGRERGVVKQADDTSIADECDVSAAVNFVSRICVRAGHKV
jgi:hypothetical protein